MEDWRARGAWKIKLVEFLLPRLKGSEAEKSDAINAVLTCLSAAQGEGIREGAEVCRSVAERSERSRHIATILANAIEDLARRHDAGTVDDARKWREDQQPVA